MCRRLLTMLAGLVLSAGLSTAGASTASAINDGAPDSADTYDAVGLAFFYTTAGNTSRCSATLVTPTVMLTAGHCADSTVAGQVLVDFRAFVTGSGRPDYPRAAVPTSGYTRDDITRAGFVAGTPVAHPAWRPTNDPSKDTASWYDVGVLVLSEPVTDRVPMDLAPVGTLDAMRTADLSKTLFRTVGYGVDVTKADGGPQSPFQDPYPVERRWADEPGKKLGPHVLWTSGNPNDTSGTGGSCTGDSGGPALGPSGTVVAVISFGHTGTCRYNNGNQRVDTPLVRDWLAGYGVG